MPITSPDYSTLNHEDMAIAIGLKIKHIPILIESFLEETIPIIERIQEAINSKDYVAIQANAHSIKGSSGNLHFTELYEMAKEIELSATAKNDSFDYSLYLNAIKDAIATIKV